MKVLIAALVLALAGCSANPTVVVETKYVVRTAPADMTRLPEREPDRTDRIGSDDEAAVWITQTESYITRLEDKFEALIEFFHRPQQ